MEQTLHIGELMNNLYLRQRPIVCFDETNPDHRQYYREFLKYNTWGRSPVRFMTEEIHTDLISYIQKKMLEFYVMQEFDHENEKPKKPKLTKIESKPKSKSSLSLVRDGLAIPSSKDPA